MANDSFRIDIGEVEAAAKLIRSMVEDLQTPTDHLDAVVQQVTSTVYGTDALGKALTGAGSSVGGLAEHQKQVLAGIHTYLQNSAAMAANLLTMVEQHRATDDLQASDLKRVLDGGTGSTDALPVGQVVPKGIPETPALPLTPTTVTEPVAPAPDPAPAPAPAPAPDSTYHNPAAPTLDYNHPRPDPETGPHGGGGGGGGHQLI
ncbi:hypothetical protein GCM10009760_51560 [Kitasatospora kazusensis]|uniref:Excreted virulence factor EspC (Type VII ESX diderm) n=1 Tax=Kitasatospora kazusensis TaxID=407974 RepID=A0ABN3A5B2_9ACTN